MVPLPRGGRLYYKKLWKKRCNYFWNYIKRSDIIRGSPPPDLQGRHVYSSTTTEMRPQGKCMICTISQMRDTWHTTASLLKSYLSADIKNSLWFTRNINFLYFFDTIDLILNGRSRLRRHMHTRRGHGKQIKLIFTILSRIIAAGRRSATLIKYAQSCTGIMYERMERNTRRPPFFIIHTHKKRKAKGAEVNVKQLSCR